MEPGSFLNINFFTALFTLVNTVGLFVVLKIYLFKPIMKMIRDRQIEIDGMYADADKAKQEASDLRTEYAQKLAFATQTGERLVKEALERGQHREAQIIRQATEEADVIREKARTEIALEKKKALHDAKNEIADLAMDIVGKVVGRSLRASDQERLVDQFVAELGETK